MKQLYITTAIFLSVAQVTLGQFPREKENISYEKVRVITENNGIDIISYFYSPKGELRLTVAKPKPDITIDKKEYFYNSNRQIVLIKKYGLLTRTSGLVYEGKDEYQYNSDGNLEEIKSYSWGLMQPTNDIAKRTTFEYGSENLVTSKTVVNYRHSGSVESTERYLYEYDNSLKLITEIKWRNDKLSMLKKMTYNSNNQLIKSESHFVKTNNYSYASAAFSNGLTFFETDGFQIEAKPRGSTVFTYNDFDFLVKITDTNHFLENDDPYSSTFEYTTYSEAELRDEKNDITIQ